MSAAEGTAGAAESSIVLLNQPVVIDNGTATIKAGFAGSSKPKVSSNRLFLWKKKRRIMISCNIVF